MTMTTMEKRYWISKQQKYSVKITNIETNITPQIVETQLFHK